MPDPSPCPEEESVLAFLAGRMSGPPLAGMESHLADCAACSDLIAALSPALTQEANAPPRTIRLDPTAGTAPSTDRSLVRGAAIGRYVILDLVGRGGMGEVYAAYDPELDRRVAVKLLRGGAAADADPTARLRLIREAQATARLSHPNVVVVHDAGTADDRVFLAMEFVEGKTLGGWLGGTPHPWPEVKELFMGAGRGLAAAHAAGLIHRDFKPHNVMVAGDGTARVMDFGLARGHDAEPDPVTDGAPATPTTGSGARALQLALTQTGALVGTPAYMAPEQFRAQRADARADQFSFCVALYEALYGERPFDSSTLAVLIDAVLNAEVRPPPPRAKVPAWLRKILLRGLAPAPEQRYPSMRELLAALSHDPARRQRRVLAAAGAALVLLAGGVSAKKLSSGRGVALCAAGAERLRGVWELPDDHTGTPRRRDATHAAFRASGRADGDGIWSAAAQVLDGFARRWADMHRDVCEATHVRGEQSAEVLDLRMGCLGDGLQHLRALTDLFAAADGQVVSQAVSAAESLPDLRQCADVAALRAVVPPPKSPEVRRRVDDVRRRIGEARVLGDVGRERLASERARPLVNEARAVGYGPLTAEVYALLGHLEERHDNMAASYDNYREALAAAEASHHDQLGAEAALQLAYIVGYHRHQADEARTWARLAEAKLDRMGVGDDLRRAWLAHNAGMVSFANGELARARTELERAIVLKRSVEGDQSLDLAASIRDLAQVFAAEGSTAAALETADRAVAIWRRAASTDNMPAGAAINNRGDYLAQLGRYPEALESYREAQGILERNTGRDNWSVGAPLTGIGTVLVALGRPAEAVPVLRRALVLRENLPFGADRAETRFALARALGALGQDPGQARAMAEQARREYGAAPSTPDEQRARQAIDAWLRQHPAATASRSKR